MGDVVVLLVLLLVCGVGVFALLRPRLALRYQARQDYRRARGTQHREQLEQCLERARIRQASLEGELSGLRQRLAHLDSRQAAELDAALSRHLIQTRLDSVPGVGPTRVASILRDVFRGHLTDLYHSERVSGIGPNTQAAITGWVNQHLKAWNQLRAADFAGKQAIVERFANENKSLSRSESTVQAQIARLQQLGQMAAAQVKDLSGISANDFAAARRAPDARLAEQIGIYMLGVFPPWGHMPGWYAELLKTTGEGAPNAGTR